MVSYRSEQRVPALKAVWLAQTFVHWQYSPAQVQALLPEGLLVDEYDAAAWVSFTPFLMADVRPPGLPNVASGLRTFPETNLRTYVRSPDGVDGVWFLSIDVACPAMLGARAIGAPYSLGALSLSRRGDVITYAGARWGGGPSYRLIVHSGRPVSPTERDVWLTSRWRVYTRSLGRLWVTPVEHEPWPLSEASIEALQETCTSAAGLPVPGEEPVVHFSEGVSHVRLGVPRPLRATPGPS